MQSIHTTMHALQVSRKSTEKNVHTNHLD